MRTSRSLRTALIAVTAIAAVGLSAAGALAAAPDATAPTAAAHDHQRVHVETVKLRDGSSAKIYQFTAGHYPAGIHGGAKTGTLDADGRAASGRNNGLHVALQPDGSLTSWVGGAGQPEPTPDGDTAPAPSTDADVSITATPSA